MYDTNRSSKLSVPYIGLYCKILTVYKPKMHNLNKDQILTVYNSDRDQISTVHDPKILYSS